MSIDISMCVSFIDPGPPFPVAIKLINFLNMCWQGINIVHYEHSKHFIGNVNFQCYLDSINISRNHTETRIWECEGPQRSHLRNLDTVTNSPEVQGLVYSHGLRGKGIIKLGTSVSDWVFLLVTVVSALLKYTQIVCDHVSPR